MVKTVLVADVLTVLVTGLAFGAEYRHQGDVVLNDAEATPGAAVKRLTAEMLCSPSFKTVDGTEVSFSVKRQVCEEYNVTDSCPGEQFEIDHLISPDLGGTNDIKNLWPQPYPLARQKDCVENRLRQLVCGGKVPLRVAQHTLATNWLSARRMYAPKCQ